MPRLQIISLASREQVQFRSLQPVEVTQLFRRRRRLEAPAAGVAGRYSRR